MQVTKHKMVSIDYTLTDDEGQIIDSSEGKEPLHYLHGEGAIIPARERALEGKGVGDQLQVTISPEDGYGERVDTLQQVVSREGFEDAASLEVGMQFRVPTKEDRDLVVRVVEIKDDAVTIDANHELAGVTLNFDVTIQGVRDATSEEISRVQA